MARINDIAIDLGTKYVTVYAKGLGIKLRQPAYVSIDRQTHRIISIGDQAYRTVGRTPGSMFVTRPLGQGEMNDFDITGEMIRYFVAQVIGKRFLSRPRAVMTVPSGVKDMEKKELISVMFDAGMRKTEIIDRNIASALGAGLNIEGPAGNMVIDISAGSTDIAVLANGTVAVHSLIRLGGDRFDESIIQYIRKKYNLLIGELTAEQVKITLGSAIRREIDVVMEVTGRSLVIGMPKTQVLHASEIYDSLQDSVSALIEAIQNVIERTPPQLAGDIFDLGITLTGGGSLLYGLAELISQTLRIPCKVAPDAKDCVLLGSAKIVDDPHRYRHLLR